MSHPKWAVARLLNFLNRTRDPEALTTAGDTVKDDPGAGRRGKGYTIGLAVAKRILEHRQQLPRRRYEHLDELLQVPGLGDDKLQDLVHSFSQPAADFFRQSLFRPAGPLYENWELEEFSAVATTDVEFQQLVGGLDRLRLAAIKCLPPADKRRNQLRASYVATFGESHLASFHFASWWYGFDQDNWFNFETIRLICEAYLGYHDSPNQMEFGFFHLYDSGNSRFNTIGTYDRIPFVINPAEQKLTVWQVALND